MAEDLEHFQDMGSRTEETTAPREVLNSPRSSVKRVLSEDVYLSDAR